MDEPETDAFSGGEYDISPFYVDPDEFETIGMLGSGAFGIVWQCKSKKTGVVVAKKVLKASGDDHKTSYKREVYIMGHARHPALLPLVGCTPWESVEPTIMTLFMPNGSVRNMIDTEIHNQRHPEWTPVRKHIVIYGTACGMAYMHRLRLIHRDLKPENILLDENFEPKIADFGLSKFVESGKTLDQTGTMGTVRYMAPEILNEGNRFGFKVDVYAFGMTMYAILSGSIPFSNFTLPYRMMNAITNGDRPKLDPHVPVPYRSLIDDCWNDSPDRRPGFDEIIERLRELAPLDEPDSYKLHEYEAKLDIQSEADVNPDTGVTKVVWERVQFVRPDYRVSQSVAETNPVVLMDIGTYSTKLGYSTNAMPTWVIPSCIGSDARDVHAGQTESETEDLDFYIGHEAAAMQHRCPNTNILQHDQTYDWDNIEHFWEQCLFKYLRCDPEDHAVSVIESMCTALSPEFRDGAAEIMFETFNVPYLYINNPAMFALGASWPNRGSKSMTGTVIDSGHDSTWIIPLVDGYVVNSAICRLPVGGRAVTEFVADLLNDREPTVPPEDRFAAAKAIKERFCKLAMHPSATFAIFDRDINKYVEHYTGISSGTGKKFTCEVGYERFLAPEILFTPEMVSSEHTTPLAVLVDRAIRLSPMSYRRELYGNIVLSGGSTMIPGFARRLQHDVQKIVDANLERNAECVSHQVGRKIAASTVDVRVVEHKRQEYTAWYGGALLAECGRAFLELCMTKEQYDESGSFRCQSIGPLCDFEGL